MSSDPPYLESTANARRTGLFPPELGPFILAGNANTCLSEAADALHGYLIDHLTDDSECVFRRDECLLVCGLSLAIFHDALDELVQENLVESSICTGSSLMIVTLSTEASVYYGSDENPEPDWESAALYDHEIAEFPLPPVDDPKRARVYAKTNGWCFYCASIPAAHIDHMNPRVRGGSNQIENLIGACAKCNLQKNDRTVEEYRAFLAHRHRLRDVKDVRFYGEGFQ